MKPLNSITLELNGNDASRIGPNTRAAKTASAVRIEKLYAKIAPLPTSFDISPIQPAYFSEFSYGDCFGGLYCYSMNEEVNARVVEKAFKTCNSVIDVTPDLFDKYTLSNTVSFPKATTIVLLPGSNLFHTIDFNLLDRLLHTDDSAIVKPHPITTDEGIRMLGRRYGYGRMADPSESGHAYVRQARRVFTTASSELGMAAALLKIPVYNITILQWYQKMSYAPIYRLLQDGNIDHNYDVVVKLLSSYTSGLVMPWHDNIEERLSNYCASAMEIREVFKPSWAWKGSTGFNNKDNTK